MPTRDYRIRWFTGDASYMSGIATGSSSTTWRVAASIRSMYGSSSRRSTSIWAKTWRREPEAGPATRLAFLRSPAGPLMGTVHYGEVNPMQGWISREYGHCEPAPLVSYVVRSLLPLRIV